MINFRRLETRSKETMFTMNSKQNSVANYLICHKILRFDVQPMSFVNPKHLHLTLEETLEETIWNFDFVHLSIDSNWTLRPNVETPIFDRRRIHFPLGIARFESCSFRSRIDGGTGVGEERKGEKDGEGWRVGKTEENKGERRGEKRGSAGWSQLHYAYDW